MRKHPWLEDRALLSLLPVPSSCSEVNTDTFFQSRSNVASLGLARRVNAANLREALVVAQLRRVCACVCGGVD